MLNLELKIKVKKSVFYLKEIGIVIGITLVRRMCFISLQFFFTDGGGR